jgi:hypothetical protein
MLKRLNIGRGLRHIKSKTTKLTLVASAILIGRSLRTISDIQVSLQGIRIIQAMESLT